MKHIDVQEFNALGEIYLDWLA